MPFLFIKPPTFKKLERRLRGRNSDSEEKIQERIKKIEYEISFSVNMIM